MQIIVVVQFSDLQIEIVLAASLGSAWGSMGGGSDTTESCSSKTGQNI